MMRRHAPLVLVLALAGHLTRVAVVAGEPEGSPPEATRSIVAAQVPSSWIGTLPCASCPGIDWTLTLLPDGTYRLRQVYREAEAGRDRSRVELGSWSLDEAPERLILRGGADGAVRFKVRGTDRLRLLDRDGAPIASELPYELSRSSAVDRIGEVVPLRGEFRYLADAGLFTDCRAYGVTYPIAHEADNAALERAYLDAAAEPGGPVLVAFQGRFASRPAMEGDGVEEAIVVERFERVFPGERCESAVDAASLERTYWLLRELPGEPSFEVDPALRAHLVFDAEMGRVAGLGGCNGLTASYTVDGSSLSFGPWAATRKACPAPAMELEARLLAALGAVSTYAIDGETLTVEGAEGPVARFERYLE